MSVFASSWLIPLNDQQGTHRLVAFPHAGAGAFTYRPWISSLPEHWSLLAVQLPGRETRIREAFANDLITCGEAIAASLAQLPQRPTVFYGHSMGAMIAFETCRALRRIGSSLPIHFVAAARRAPHIPEPRPCHLADDQELAQVVMRLGAAQSQLLKDARLRSFFLPIIRADFTLFEAYAYTSGEPLSCPITVFSGSKDTEVASWELMAWESHTHNDFSSQTYEAGHFFHQSHSAMVCSNVCALNLSSPAEGVLCSAH